MPAGSAGVRPCRGSTLPKVTPALLGIVGTIETSRSLSGGRTFTYSCYPPLGFEIWTHEPGVELPAEFQQLRKKESSLRSWNNWVTRVARNTAAGARGKEINTAPQARQGDRDARRGCQDPGISGSNPLRRHQHENHLKLSADCRSRFRAVRAA
jgi:hypothetical protein